MPIKQVFVAVIFGLLLSASLLGMVRTQTNTHNTQLPTSTLNSENAPAPSQPAVQTPPVSVSNDCPGGNSTTSVTKSGDGNNNVSVTADCSVTSSSYGGSTNVSVHNSVNQSASGGSASNSASVSNNVSISN